MEITNMKYEDFLDLVLDVQLILNCCTECDEEWVACPDYSEMSFAHIAWSYFADRYMKNRGSSFEQLDEEKIQMYYDNYLDESVAELRRLLALAEHFHVVPYTIV
jgi:hypothetical protein